MQGSMTIRPYLSWFDTWVCIRPVYRKHGILFIKNVGKIVSWIAIIINHRLSLCKLFYKNPFIPSVTTSNNIFLHLHSPPTVIKCIDVGKKRWYLEELGNVNIYLTCARIHIVMKKNDFSFLPSPWDADFPDDSVICP